MCGLGSGSRKILASYAIKGSLEKQTVFIIFATQRIEEEEEEEEEEKKKMMMMMKFF